MECGWIFFLVWKYYKHAINGGTFSFQRKVETNRIERRNESRRNLPNELHAAAAAAAAVFGDR